MPNRLFVTLPDSKKPPPEVFPFSETHYRVETTLVGRLARSGRPNQPLLRSFLGSLRTELTCAPESEHRNHNTSDHQRPDVGLSRESEKGCYKHPEAENTVDPLLPHRKRRKEIKASDCLPHLPTDGDMVSYSLSLAEIPPYFAGKFVRYCMFHRIDEDDTEVRF